jgi:hypothetical protein
MLGRKLLFLLINGKATKTSNYFYNFSPNLNFRSILAKWPPISAIPVLAVQFSSIPFLGLPQLIIIPQGRVIHFPMIFLIPFWALHFPIISNKVGHHKVGQRMEDGIFEG